METEKIYRPCVGIMLINKDGLVWIGKREKKDPPDAYWQMPQGGIDEGEETVAAARRELFEETSVNTVTLVRESSEWLTYDVPGGLKRGTVTYAGQKQKWVMFRFDGDDSEIDIVNVPDGEEQEFIEWRWESMENLPGLVVPFKQEVYHRIIREFAGDSNNV